MNVLPQAIANGRNHSGIIAGKLNGVIAATTPTGWRTISTSTPPPTPSRFSPLSRWGIPIAASADSIPRRTSPRASSIALPMSAVTSWAISSWFSQSASRRAITARARFCGARRAPGGQRLARRGDGGVDVGGAGERDERGDLAADRVDVVEACPSAIGAVQAPPA